MSDNVIRFEPKGADEELERLIWVCDCGCTVHYHYSDGSIVCSACKTEQCIDCLGEWRSRLPDTPDEPKELDETNFKIVELSDAKQFLKRQIKAHEGEDKITLAVVAYADGGLCTWSEPLTDEQVAWAKRKLNEAAAWFDKAR